MVAGLRERDRLERLFARHVGGDVASRAKAASGLSGTQTEATVMFVDIIGSTALAAERPPEAVVSMINALFDRVVAIVGAEGGLVNQFQGDGALCIFGAPMETPDHAARALRSAIALRREVVALSDVFPGFDAAIGVSTGLVVAGDVGTEDRSEYTVIGDAANEAKRLTDQAKERRSRVLVGETTVRAARAGDGEWLPAGTLELRGRPAPTGVFEPA
jgi:adenylate cyclase